MMKKFFIVAISAFIFFGCEDKEPVSCYLKNPKLSSNSPLLTGESIMLKSTNVVFEDAIYEWTGPNDFHSSERNPVIPNATTAMAGEYKLKITRGICESEVVSTDVSLITNTVNCSVVDNHITFRYDYFPDTYLYYFQAGPKSDNTYQIYGGGVNGNVTITFKGNNIPETGIYSIVNSNDLIAQNKVFVKLNRSDVLNFYALSGDVVVSKANGKLSAKFCDMPFSVANSNQVYFTANAKLIDNN
jgi:hypothetical protein